MSRKPRIYTASRAIHAPLWRDLRKNGHHVVATWIDETRGEESSGYATLAARCIQEAVLADFVLLYCEPNEVLEEPLIEVGAALAAGKEIRCVGECTSISRVFQNHRLWKSFPSIEKALVEQKP